ncbi:hypothetical protein BIV57_14515 [Mangrovactinospora gilvigrisea]|uniref:Uncharacterized protein n=1 Tax=Mangrovactinospora gilvigrisea TaxID=1428644 RepID=A0A1J7BDU1_9ACTN|nr:hypothetical protein [Mangrovactinospora gilvigrisea]OIV36749.1 hypothetical protein BIV57_14515 [Mangrovactinospora gilvigrisea]
MFVDSIAGTNVEMFRLRAAELIREADEQRLLREIRKSRRDRGRKAGRPRQQVFHHGSVTS